MRICISRPAAGAIIGLTLAMAESPAAGQSQWVYEYAAQIDCALANDDAALANGLYGTTINIHNPAAGPNGLRWKVAIAVPITGAGSGGPVSGFADLNLGSDRAVRIECPTIKARLSASNIQLPAVISGFVVIQSNRPLDVVAVYTAMPIVAPSGGPVSAMHVERIPERIIH